MGAYPPKVQQACPIPHDGGEESREPEHPAAGYPAGEEESEGDLDTTRGEGERYGDTKEYSSGSALYERYPAHPGHFVGSDSNYFVL